jgi:MFS family permease
MLLGAVGAFAAFGPIVGPELTGRDREPAILFGLYYVGTAVGARVAGRLMDRVGRRPGLAAGYVAIAVSGVVAWATVKAASAGGLRVSFVILGAGVGAALLGRAAVADLYPPERRGRAVGFLVMAGTIGAVGGPVLAGALSAAASGPEGDLATAPWLLASGLAVAALPLVAMLRPDPRSLAVGPPASDTEGRRPRTVLLARPALSAVVTVAMAQAVMVMFMSVIPAVVHRHGSSDLSVSLIVSIHLGAMFAFSSLIGMLLDASGRTPGLLFGVALLGAGVGLSLVGAEPLPGGGGLFLIGVGWSATYLASTAVVSDLTRPHERAAALGATDLVAGLCAAVGVFGGAFLLGATDYVTLAVSALVVLAVPLPFIVATRRGRESERSLV